MTDTEKLWNKALRKMSRSAPKAPAEPAPVLDKLESVTCGRCGGTGRYPSSCYNGICLACNGAGYRLTKRGAAAADFLRKLREVQAGSLQVGDTILQGSVTMTGTPFDYWAKIVEVQPPQFRGARSLVDGEWVEHAEMRIVTESPKYGPYTLVCRPDHSVRKGYSKEEKAAQFQKALAYQATLTKLGKPRKK